MNEERLMQVLRAPHVSEKSTRVADEARQVVFRVAKDADKREIKQAVEKMFKVEVEGVQVLNVKGKRKGMQRSPGKRTDWKKAYVRLKEGHDIDFSVGE